MSNVICGVVQQLLKSEKTLAAVSRELEPSPTPRHDGYRRVWAMVNRTFPASYDRKRIRRLMRVYGLMLPPRIHRRHGRPHLSQVQQPASNQRWCSDTFLIPC